MWAEVGNSVPTAGADARAVIDDFGFGFQLKDISTGVEKFCLPGFGWLGERGMDGCGIPFLALSRAAVGRTDAKTTTAEADDPLPVMDDLREVGDFRCVDGNGLALHGAKREPTK